MFNLFEKKTKWQPLVAYNYTATDYIVFVRKGLKSGMIYFKTKRITPIGVCSYNFDNTLFDIKKQFEDVISEALRQHDVSGQSEQLVCPCCGSDKTYKTEAIHCNRCVVTTEI